MTRGVEASCSTQSHGWGVLHGPPASCGHRRTTRDDRARAVRPDTARRVLVITTFNTVASLDKLAADSAALALAAMAG